MSRVNLLPPEVRRARLDAKRARSITLVGFALAALLGAVYLVRTVQVFTLNGDLEDVRTEQAMVQAEIDSYAEVAAKVLGKFAGDEIAPADMLRMCEEAYGSFSHKAVVPMVQIGPQTFIAELFHGQIGRAHV